MIVWLASYPRSGNTLLRTIFKQTMGLGSYSDEPLSPAVRFSATAVEEFGNLPIDEPWESFYEKASTSAALHLVKTHLPPRDAQPAIYVVRDGRQSLVSYHNYHRKFFPEHQRGVMNLMLGDDHYGGWSEHHARWFSGTSRTLLVRYEDLVTVTPGLLREIAEFIDYVGTVSPWKNPFDKLHRENPAFFRQGEVRWEPSPEWTPFVNRVFFHIHGELMRALHYADNTGLEDASFALDPDLAQFVELARSLLRQKQDFHQVCKERLAVINLLDTEVRRLSTARRGTWPRC